MHNRQRKVHIFSPVLIPLLLLWIGSDRITQEQEICSLRVPPLNKSRPEISRSNSASRSFVSDQSRFSGAGLSRWSGKTSTNHRASYLNKRLTKRVVRLVGRMLFMLTEQMFKET